MKNKGSNNILQTAAIASKVLFWVGSAMVVLLFLVNYFSWSDGQTRFTVRGDVTLIKKDWKPAKRDFYETKDTIGLSSIVLIKKSAFTRLDYTDVSKGLSLKNILCVLASFANFALWALVLFQVMKILNDVNRDNTFGKRNINRIRWIALAFILSPILAVTRDFIFARILIENIEIPDHYILSNSFKQVRWEILKGGFVSLLLLALAETFKKGMELKSENDLTV